VDLLSISPYTDIDPSEKENRDSDLG